jgi:hypothetical protein
LCILSAISIPYHDVSPAPGASQIAEGGHGIQGAELDVTIPSNPEPVAVVVTRTPPLQFSLAGRVTHGLLSKLEPIERDKPIGRKMREQLRGSSSEPYHRKLMLRRHRIRSGGDRGDGNGENETVRPVRRDLIIDEDG